MNIFKKYWWALVAIIVVVFGVYLIFGGKKVEYAELKDEPHIKGNPEASISLLEYSDFECPACGAAYPVVNDILAKYGDKIKFEFRQFPLTTIHRYAYQAAAASECAADQGKFWEYYDLLFANQKNLAKTDLISYAGKINGLDAELWKDCLLSGVKNKRVDEDIADSNSQNLNSTPTFFLNSQPVADWGTLEQAIKNLLEPQVPLIK